MRLGCRIWVPLLVLFFSCASYAFLPLLLGASAIEGALVRVVASRAASVAANDAVYLTTVNGTRTALNSVASNLASNVVKKNIFKLSATVLSWAGVAYGLNELADDFFTVNTDNDGNVIVSTGPDSSFPYFGYISASGAGDVINGSNMDSIYNQIFAILQNRNQLTCPTTSCTYGALYNVTTNAATNGNTTYSGYYDYTYK